MYMNRLRTDKALNDDLDVCASRRVEALALAANLEWPDSVSSHEDERIASLEGWKWRSVVGIAGIVLAPSQRFWMRGNAITEDDARQHRLTERMSKRKDVHINLIQRERKVADGDKGNLSQAEAEKLCGDS